MLTGMQIGSQYSVTWSERDRPHYQSRALTVKIGGCEGVDISSEHMVPDRWEMKQATFVATAISTVLCFITAGGTQDGSVFLDAIAAEGTKTWRSCPCVDCGKGINYEAEFVELSAYTFGIQKTS